LPFFPLFTDRFLVISAVLAFLLQEIYLSSAL